MKTHLITVFLLASSILTLQGCILCKIITYPVVFLLTDAQPQHNEPLICKEDPDPKESLDRYFSLIYRK